MLPIAVVAWAAALAAVLMPGAAAGVAITAWAGAAASLLVAAAAARRAAATGPRASSDAESSSHPADPPATASRPRECTSVGLLPHPGRLRAWSTLASIALAAAAVAASHAALAQPVRAAIGTELDARVSSLTIVVTTKIEPVADGVRFDGSAHVGGRTATVSVNWRGGSPPDGLDLGARVEVSGDAEPTGPGDAAVAIVFAERVEVRAPPPHIFAVASTLRRGFVDDIASGLPEPGAGLLPGLSVGETSGVSDELDAAMKASSLSHLTAVSGSNCALVVGIAFGASALCGAGRRTRIACSLLVLAGFVVLVTPEASVIRAATMAAIAMIALLVGRRGSGVAVLSLAVTILVAADPWLATSYGFLLSAGATGALLLLAEPLARSLERWMPRGLALGIAVPLAAQIVCGPIIVLFAPEVALYGVVANIIAAPAAPLATVLGLVACVAQPFAPLALGAAALAWAPSAWIAQTATTFASLPAARLPWHEGWTGFFALAAFGACVVAAIVRPPPRRAWMWIHRAGVAVLSLALGVGSGAVAWHGAVAPLATPRDWAIALCDVGQGDAILLRSAGRIGLVDTGPDRDALDACLARLGIDRIDTAFLTHFDADHAADLPALAGRVSMILHGPAASVEDLAPARAASDDVREASAGMHGTLGDASWRVLWPTADTRAFAPGNDTSLVVEFDGPGMPRALLLGDLSADAQQLLLASGRLTGEFDVVKVSHHGSRDQLPQLYVLAAPRIALIGVGENDYGHPHPDLLATLARSGASVARTDADGLVLVSAADGLRIWRERR